MFTWPDGMKLPRSSTDSAALQRKGQLADAMRGTNTRVLVTDECVKMFPDLGDHRSVRGYLERFLHTSIKVTRRADQAGWMYQRLV